MYGFIYITTNHINNKKYIGQRFYDENGRWKNYLGSGLHIKRAIKKYGKENFSKEILQECNSKEELDKAEIYWIDKYNAVESDNFYNIASGGQGGDISIYLSEEQMKDVKDKLSKSHKGLLSGDKNNHSVLTEEQVIEIIDKLLQAESCDDIAKDYGVSYNIIHHIKNHDTWTYLTKDITFPKNRKRRNDGKEVIQYDKKGFIINKFKNIKIASRETNIDYRHISAVCNGKKLSAGGYIWRFKGDDFNKYRIERVGISIDKYDLDGIYVDTYFSLNDANNSISYGKVESVLYGNAKSAGGFYWCKSGETFIIPSYSKKSQT